MSMPTVRIRGIYTTALTKFLLKKKWKIVQMSETMEKRFGIDSDKNLADIDLRQNNGNGLMAIGDNDDLTRLKEILEREFLDICFRMEKVQLYGIYKGKTVKKRGKKRIIDIPDGRVLCYDAVKEGDLLQVHDMRKMPVVRSKLTFPGKNIVLIPNRAVKISRRIKDSEKRERLYKIGKKHIKDLGVLFRSSAMNKDEEELVEEIEDLYDETEKILNSFELFSTPSIIREGNNVLKIYFGRNSKEKLDTMRNEVVPTMNDHHHYKNAEGFSAAVDLGELLIEQDVNKKSVEKSFANVFESSVEEYLSIECIKEYPITLGDAKVLEFEPPKLLLKRKIYGKGYYNGHNIKREYKDYALIEIEEGKWQLTRKYYSKKDELKVTQYTICTPVEIYPSRIRYIDLEIGVLEGTDGNKRIVNKGKLEEAVKTGRINEKLGKKAVDVAKSLVD
ncbi:MAG: ribonuclease E/G [Euryarchaeota archaeon]|nr:ribonuclease E/G [Euryarchaeota archaeon]